MRRPLFLRAAAILSALCLPYKLVQAQDPTSGFDVFITPTNNQQVPAGSNFDIIWVPSSPAGKVSIVLMQGGSELDQDDGPTIASGIDSTSGKYTWSVPSSSGNFASYGFRLQLDSDPSTFQYSYAFQILRDPNAPPPSTSRPSNRAPTTIVTTHTAASTDNPPSSTASSPNADTTNLPAKSSLISSGSLYATSTGSSSGGNSGSGTISPTATSALNQTSPSTSAGSLQTGASSSNTDNSLSTAAKVGIAVGGATALCILILLAYIAVLMRRRNALKKVPSEGLELAEDDKLVGNKEHKISELESAMVSEMMSEMRLELDGKTGAGELHGSDEFEKTSGGKRKSLGVIHEVHELP